MKRVFWRISLRRAGASEEGFTFIELMIAVGIILTALLSMLYLSTIGFTDVALARQRQGASQLANQTMEQIRGLPFDTIKKGLASWDLGGDPNIVSCASAKCYQPLSETIPTSAYAAATVITPLVPHTRTITVGPTEYTVSAYVTYYLDNKNSSSTYRAIVIVTWNNVARQGVSSRVENQSILFSGNGCLSTATHPFAGPCQPFLYATATASTGHVDVTGNFPGSNFARGTLWTADITSAMQVEQVSSVQGNTQMSGVSMAYTDAAEVFKNRTQASSAADNDPAQSDPDYTTASLPGNSVQKITVNGDNGSLWVQSRAGDTGSTTSTVTADVARPCQSETDELPCGNATMWPGQFGIGTQKTMSEYLDVDAGDVDLGQAQLAWMDSPSAQSIVSTDRNTKPGTNNCKGTSGDGCVHMEGTRYLGQYSIGGLPLLLPAGCAPLGWLGYFVRLSNFTDTAKAEVGTGTTTPTLSVSGTVSYWNGAGYSTMALAPGAQQTIPVAPMTCLLPLFPGGPLQISIQADGLSTGGTQLTDPAGCGTSCTRTSAEAISYSPIVGDVLYTILWNTETLADLTIHTDLGLLEASGQYTPAPSS